MHSYVIPALITIAFALPAFAQEASPETGAPAVVDIDAGAALEAETDGGVLTDDFRTYPALISRMRAHASVDYPTSTEQVPAVIVRLSELSGDKVEGLADLKAELTSQGAALDEIRAVIEANDNIRAQLETHNMSAQAVVAISRESDGTLLVYVDDTANDATD